MVKCLPEFEYFTVFLKNRNFFSKIKRSKGTDYAALNFFSADPTEHFDIADKHPDVLEKMKDMLKQYRESLVPANQPDPDPKSDPKNFDGNWSPGWCP